MAPQEQTIESTSATPPALGEDTYVQQLLRALEENPRHTPSSHRYVSFDIVSDEDLPFPWGHDFLGPERGHEMPMSPGLHWWSIEQTGHRVARSLDAGKGRRIADYLRSAKYDCSKPFNGSYIHLSLGNLTDDASQNTTSTIFEETCIGGTSIDIAGMDSALSGHLVFMKTSAPGTVN